MVCARAWFNRSADADLYLALWHEAIGNDAAALSAMESAVGSPYGPATGDYMWHLALVHAALRGWTATAVEQGGGKSDL
jgi:hypothetical protein